MSISKKNIIFAAVCIIVVLFCEVFIFNYQSFITPGNGTPAQLDISQATLVGLSCENGVYKSTGEKFSIEFNDIDVPVKTIRTHIDFASGYVADLSADFTDDTNMSYSGRYGLITHRVIGGDENSEFIHVQTSGKVHDLRFRFTLPKNTVVTFDGDAISLNAHMPISFSFVRVFIILFVVFLLRFLFKSGISGRPISDCKADVGYITFVVAIVCVLIAFLLVLTSVTSFGELFTLIRPNQITQELVDAFENGQLHLLRPVEDELLELENPYDWSERRESGVSFAWDHLFYNGKYYSYYGIAPVLLLFLPYHMLTGNYFPCNLSVFIFGALGLVFLVLAFKRFMRALFSDIPFGIYLSSLLMLVCSCGIWYCFLTPNFYEIAQNSGFMFVTLGAWLLFSSNILQKDERIRYLPLALSSAALSLAVLCRPTTAVWCIASVVIIAYGFVVRIKVTQKKEKVAYLLSSLLPFALIGGVQMMYNYLRFGSFIDFGIQYSLTINDFTRSEFSVNLALIGFYNFLLAVPVINTKFPFIHASYSDLDINGFYYMANDDAIGIFFRALPMIFIFFAPSVFGTLEKKKRIFPSVIWLLCTLVLPFVIIFSIWESGYGVRYCVDFAWQMLLGAFTVMFLYYRRHPEKRNAVKNFTYISLILCMLVAAATTVEYTKTSVGYDQAVEAIANGLEFWH